MAIYNAQRFTSFSKVFSIFSTVLILSASAVQADDTESPSKVLTRTANTPLFLDTELSKNIYRTMETPDENSSEDEAKTKTETVLDHQWKAQVHIMLPPETFLQDNEEESYTVSLEGTEEEPKIAVQVDSQFYNYEVIEPTAFEDNQFKVTLGLAPKYSKDDIGEGSVEGLALTQEEGKHQIQFHDRGIFSRTYTTYTILILDLTDKTRIFETHQEGVFGKENYQFEVPAEIDSSHDFKLQVSVYRQPLYGSKVIAPTLFHVEKTLIAQLDPSAYQDSKLVGGFSIEGNGSRANLVFADKSPENADVETYYEILILKKPGFWDPFVGKTNPTELIKGRFKRAEPITFENNLIVIPLEEFLVQANAGRALFDQVTKKVKKNKELYINVRVKRQSPRLEAVSPIQFDIGAKVKVKAAK